MKSYLGIILIGLITSNTLITDSSKIEFARILKANESILKEKLEYLVHVITIIVKFILDFKHLIAIQENYKIILEKVKLALNELKKILKKYSIKEIEEKFVNIVNQYQDFIRKIPSTEIAEEIVKIIEKIKDFIINTDFGDVEYLLVELKKKLKNFDPKIYAEKVVKEIEKLKKPILDFSPSRFFYDTIEKNFEKIKTIVSDPIKEKELIDKFINQIQKSKKYILNLDIEGKAEYYKHPITFFHKVLVNRYDKYFYDRINAYYPIINMFFLFFEPKKIVDILRDTLKKIIVVTKNIDADILYDFAKKFVEYLRVFIGDDYAEIILKYIKIKYMLLKKFIGEINIEKLSKEINNQLTNLKNFILEHDTNYFINEFKETSKYVDTLLEVYNPRYIIASYISIMYNLQKVYKKFDIELAVSAFQELINLLKEFFNDIKKNKFLSL